MGFRRNVGPWTPAGVLGEFSSLLKIDREKKRTDVQNRCIPLCSLPEDLVSAMSLG